MSALFGWSATAAIRHAERERAALGKQLGAAAGAVPDLEKPLAKRVAVVTGASAGCGRETARALSEEAGMTVVLAVRNVEKGRAVVATFKPEAAARCHVLKLDLCSLASVRQFAAEFAELNLNGGELDLLIMNAGMWASSFVLTEDGLESDWQVHVVANYLLVRLLQPRLTASKAARVIFVSSQAHIIGKLRFPDEAHPKGFLCDSAKEWTSSSWVNGFQPYAQAKLAQIVLAKRLSTELAPHGVFVGAAHPGGVATDIYPVAVRPLMMLVLMPPEYGATAQTYMAVKPLSSATPAFEYWRPSLLSRPIHSQYASAADDVAVQERLMKEVAKMAGL